MKIEEAMQKGFLNISESDADKLLGDLFDDDDPTVRLDAGLALLGTFVPAEKITMVLDLAQVVIDANEEIEFSGGNFDADEED
ncbi:MAG: hypothetical protein IH600_06920 [Bacteroidetes bacterium]|nr:hypothetical protein [Bacteroidota bacterium]